MKSLHKRGKAVPAEEIAEREDKGEDVSRFFNGKGRMMPPVQAPIQRVNVDFAAGMLGELDRAAEKLNISRQALIKTLVRQALDQHYMAQRAAGSQRRPAARGGSKSA